MQFNKIFEDNIKNIYGSKGEQWLADLPSIIADISKEWNLTNLQPATNLSFNAVLFGYMDTQAIILKLSFSPEALKKEANALLAFSHHGCVEVLKLRNDALLLQCAVPGVSLQDSFAVDELTYLKIALPLIDLLHMSPVPAQHQFPSLHDWFATFDKDWPLPKNYLARARILRDKLLNTGIKPALLHGDMHQANIISNHNGWLIIDPKGVVGDPIFDKVGCLIREPIEPLLQHHDMLNILRNRIEFVAGYLHTDSVLIMEWTLLQAVLSCCWLLEDNLATNKMLKFIDKLTRLIEEKE